MFGEYDLPESASVEAAPWPRLVDTPAAPPPGTYSAAVPDPAVGTAVSQDLTAEAAAAQVRARALARPILTDAERAELLRRARRPRP